MTDLIMIDPSRKSISVERFDGTYDGMKVACGWEDCHTDKVGIGYQTWMFVKDDARYTEGSRFKIEGISDIVYGRAAIVTWPSVTKDEFLDVSTSVDAIQGIVTWI